MDTVRWIISTAPEIFLLLAVAIGTILGRLKILGFSIGGGGGALIAGLVVTLVPLIVATLFAHHVLRMNPVVTCGALAGAMTVDAAVTGACEVAESQTPVLGVAVPYAAGNVVLTVLGPIIVASTFAG
jgi:uncharacterized transporter YbjL